MISSWLLAKIVPCYIPFLHSNFLRNQLKVFIMFSLSTYISAVKILWVALICLAFTLGGGFSAMASKSDLQDLNALQAANKPIAPVYVTQGKAELISVPGDVADVLVANPSIVDVMAIQSNKLYVVGLNIGDTNLIILDGNGDVLKRVDIHVKYDLQAIQSLIGELFPNEAVKVSAIHDQILITGTVSNPERATKISNLVAHYVSDLQDEEGTPDELVSNLMEVRGEQQVMLQVKIVEATRSVLKELGVETNFNDTNELSATSIFGGQPNTSNFGNSNNLDPSSLAFATGAGLALTQDPVGVGRALFDSGISGIGTVGLFLNALEEQNLVNILAEPNLTAVSGQQAGFLAGGEFPVPVGRDQVGNLVIEFREFGVSLNFRPMVLSDERISLQLDTEVSSLDFESAIVLADVTVPGLDIRRAETTVEIPSGGSLMIAGLLESQAIEGMSGLPGVANTPVIGDLVRSDSFQRDETELVVIVTPYLVKPYAEKSRAAPVSSQANNPLARVFAKNIRRQFDVKDEELFALDERYGYILD